MEVCPSGDFKIHLIVSTLAWIRTTKEIHAVVLRCVFKEARIFGPVGEINFFSEYFTPVNMERKY